MDEPRTNPLPKVLATAGGAGIGGGTLATLVCWFLQGAVGMATESFTIERVIAITSLCGIPAGVLVGYMKKMGIETKE